MKPDHEYPQNNKAAARRKWYPLKTKAAAVEKVKAGTHAARVAADYGVPAQTLANWLRADRDGTLGELVRLSVSEMERIMEYCSTTTDGNLDFKGTPAEKKALVNLKKKINAALNRARRVANINGRGSKEF